MMGIENYKKASVFHNISKVATINSGYYKKNIYKVYNGSEKIELKTKNFNTSLINAIISRRTERDFKGNPIEYQELCTILYYSYGITGELGNGYQIRNAPSAGARYPIEIYLLSYNCNDLVAGIYHYNCEEHSIEKIGNNPNRNDLLEMLNYQKLAENAGLLIILTADFERNMAKYGERGYRYIFLDAGHIAQNIVLICSAQNIKSTLIGGFDDNRINNMLDLDGNKESIIYACAIGR